MCVIYIAYRQQASYPLILLANRDEFYDRPTAAAARWKDFPQIIAGRDLVAGGTWLGVTDSGRFAAVTNFRDPGAGKGDRSRGDLVAEFLKSGSSAYDYMKTVRAVAESYSGFNLILGQINAVRQELYYFSNRSDGIRALDPGIYGLSNHLLNTPWPKVKTGISRFERTIDEFDGSTNLFFELLADETQAEAEELPDTGVGLAREKLLSPIFIRTPVYGTRCSTVLTIDSSFAMEFEERVFV